MRILSLQLILLLGSLSFPAGWAMNLCLLATTPPTFSPLQSDGDFPVGVLSAKGKISVEGRIQFTAKSKFVDPLLYSGDKIYVSEGEAKLELLLGGEIKLCQETRLVVLQSRSPHLFTLEKGSVAFELPQSHGDSFLTPDFLVSTEVNSPQKESNFKGEITVEPGGVICVKSFEGKLRIASQDNRGYLTLPGGASIRLNPGEIKQELLSLNQNCFCQTPLSTDKAKDLITSLQPSPHRRSFLGSIHATFKRILHLFTFGLV